MLSFRTQSLCLFLYTVYSIDRSMHDLSSLISNMQLLDQLMLYVSSCIFNMEFLRDHGLAM